MKLINNIKLLLRLMTQKNNLVVYIILYYHMQPAKLDFEIIPMIKRLKPNSLHGSCKRLNRVGNRLPKTKCNGICISLIA